MLRHISLAEDLALKRLATTPLDQKPGFAWREALGDSSFETALPEVIVTRGTGDERQFNLADVADEIGAALTDLLLSREEKDIFNEENRAFVANVAHSVATRLLDHPGGSWPQASEYDLSCS
jgi:ribonucleoside-diphosphate reductase alpha chain